MGVLSAAVRITECDLETCDVDGSCAITAGDALLVLRRALDPSILLSCNCDGPELACTSFEFAGLADSDLDSGWKGTGHNADLVEGATTVLEVVSRCDGSAAVCETDAECGGSACVSTCDCLAGGDTSCELSGPSSPSACLADTALACTEDSECGSAGGACVTFFGPPLPLVADGTPVCVTTYFETDITGTADTATGEFLLGTRLRSRVHLGLGVETPCPRCGGGSQNLPSLGDVAVCEGGAHDGEACVVDGVSADFGGVSSDCPPDVTTNVSGVGLAIVIDELTSETTERQAVLPCGAPNDFHPDNDNALCLGDFSTCDSNADCLDGSDCGFYCHCGFCDTGTGADPDLPCFSDADCAVGSCVSVGSDLNLSQAQPNACESFVCGEVSEGECCAAGEPGCDNPTTRIGTCDVIPAVCGSNSDCVVGGNGTVCELENRACFETTIERTGIPSPLGSYCTEDPEAGACNSDADCAIGVCEADTAEPVAAGLFCIPATASAGINAAAGTPGPGAVLLANTMRVCRCGDGTQGCSEACDDGNNADGDGCSASCEVE